jgi:hypothetical protein
LAHSSVERSCVQRAGVFAFVVRRTQKALDLIASAQVGKVWALASAALASLCESWVDDRRLPLASIQRTRQRPLLSCTGLEMVAMLNLCEQGTGGPRFDLP